MVQQCTASRGFTEADAEFPEVIACITQTKAEAHAELATLPEVTPEWIEERFRVAEMTNWSRYASVQALIVQKAVHGQLWT